MKKEEDIICTDFQGWPVYKMNLRELLEGLGATEKDGVLGFSSTDPILDLYPETLEDDGMGYGVDSMYLTEANVIKEKNKIYIFREKGINNN